MDEQVAANTRAQRELYGEPLADVLGRVMATFTLKQASLASVLGISAPMLSQLMSAHRVKIGNPAVVLRLQALQDLAQRVQDGDLQDADVAAALEAVRGSTGAWTRPETRTTAPGDEDVVAALRGLLRAAASEEQLIDAADLLDLEQPGLAEVVRVYGLGSAAAAVQHYRATRGR